MEVIPFPFLTRQGRHLLQNDKDMPNNPGAKQAWQAEYEVIFLAVLVNRGTWHLHIDCTRETD